MSPDAHYEPTLEKLREVLASLKSGDALFDKVVTIGPPAEPE